MKTTLNKIREFRPCAGGWEKLLRTLGKTKADDEPVSVIQILDSNGLDDALWCLRAVEGHEREIRLYAVWCARQVQHLMTDQRSLDALDVAERFANGEATHQELIAAYDAAYDAAYAAARTAAYAAGLAADAARAAAAAAAADAARTAARAARAARTAAHDAARTAARAARTAAHDAARTAAHDAAHDAAHYAARTAAHDAAHDAARTAAHDAAHDAAYAAYAAQERELRRVCELAEQELNK